MRICADKWIEHRLPAITWVSPQSVPELNTATISDWTKKDNKLQWYAQICHRYLQSPVYNDAHEYVNKWDTGCTSCGARFPLDLFFSASSKQTQLNWTDSLTTYLNHSLSPSLCVCLFFSHWLTVSEQLTDTHRYPVFVKKTRTGSWRLICNRCVSVYWIPFTNVPFSSLNLKSNQSESVKRPVLFLQSSRSVWINPQRYLILAL